MTATSLHSLEALYRELWASLASLLRSYAAAHGLHKERYAIVDSTEDKITAHYGEKWLLLTRSHQSVTWTRENGMGGTLQLTEHGGFRGPAGDEAMDMAAEHWARELMH